QEQDGDQKDGERRKAHYRWNQDARQHHHQAENEHELLAALILADPERRREKSEHQKSHQRDALSKQVRQPEMLFGKTHEGADRVAETHGQEGQEDGDGGVLVPSQRRNLAAAFWKLDYKSIGRAGQRSHG